MIQEKYLSLVVSAFLVLILASPGEVKAQDISTTDSTEFAFMPALAYNSDFGFMGGGLSSWYRYRDNTQPFYSYLTLAGILSTKGLASFQIVLDKPQAFGMNIRLLSEFYVSRFFEDTYFGIGNYSKIEDNPPGLPDYYLFNSFSLGLRNSLRLPVFTNNYGQQLDANFIVELGYETPWDNGDDRSITLDPPPIGVDGSRAFMIGTGFIWEGRNSEFRPTSGNYMSTRMTIGNKLWGSSLNLLTFESDMRQYLSFFLIRDITFANRLYFRHTSGDVPYWMLSYAGDETTLRGFQAKRFLDDNAVIFNSELRTWLFEIKSIGVRFGGNLFFDVGRTFSNGTSFSDISSDLKYSIGFSGTSSFFTPDFILRTDVGFSEEGTGVYFTFGYMF